MLLHQKVYFVISSFSRELEAPTLTYSTKVQGPPV